MRPSFFCVALSALVVSCDFSASSKVLLDTADTAASDGGAEEGIGAFIEKRAPVWSGE